jgi:hypothetical protein
LKCQGVTCSIDDQHTCCESAATATSPPPARAHAARTRGTGWLYPSHPPAPSGRPSRRC